MASFTAKPLTPDTWDDLVTVFGGGAGKGDPGRCWCMWWRSPRGALGSFQTADNKTAFRGRVLAGPPPGLVGYAAGEPVGWIQVGPRADVPEWNRAGRITAPLDAEDADDPAIWGVSCFVVRTGHRRKGHAGALLDAAIGWARENGATALDACPVAVTEKKASSALYHGPADLFVRRGFATVGERRPGRPLMRLMLAG